MTAVPMMKYTNILPNISFGNTSGYPDMFSNKHSRNQHNRFIKTRFLFMYYK
jgi:hypothetical protein